MKTVIRGALAATFLSATCAAGLAADLPAPPPPAPPPTFVDSYQPFQVRLKVGGVVPTNGAGTVYDFGAVYPGLPNGGSLGLATGLSGRLQYGHPGREHEHEHRDHSDARRRLLHQQELGD